MTLQNKEPLFSIIIPVYNSYKYIEKCLDSVLNQSFKDFEIICINDFSKDNSEKIIEKYCILYPNVKLINNESNVGAGKSRNIGLNAACGKYIMFLDSDDWLTDNALKKLADQINNYPEAEVISYIYYDYEEKSGNTALLQNIPQNLLNKITNAYENPDCLNFLGYGMQKLLSREFLLKNQIYFNNYICSEDQEHLIDIVKNAKSILFTNEIVFYYRHSQKSRSTCTYLYLEYFRNQIKKINNLFKEEWPDIYKVLLEKIYPHYFQSLIKSYGCFHTTYNEFKKILSEDFDKKIVIKNSTCYYSKIYNQIIEQKKPSLYFRILFSSKVYFPTAWKIYKNFKIYMIECKKLVNLWQK